MNKLLKWLFVSMVVLLTSCNKFLDVRPIDDLTGNNYWENEKNAELFVRGIYGAFRQATMGDHRMDGIVYFPATGDFRCAPFKITEGSIGSEEPMQHLQMLQTNNISRILEQYRDNSREAWTRTTGYFGYRYISDWSRMYTVVAKANIAVFEISRMEGAQISQAMKDQLIAESIFMRNLAYFFLVRVFGDVPYYTSAYLDAALPRTEMLEVLETIKSDLLTHYKSLPWTYLQNTTEIGNRAQRGGAIALLMHINMWLAGFSERDKEIYYREVDRLGEEIMSENNGAYDLLPLNQTKLIFKGRTKEGLFEIAQNFNYGEIFGRASTYSDYVLKFPYKAASVTKSMIYYEKWFLDKLFPPSEADQRATAWFADLYNQQGNFIFLKFTNIFFGEGEDQNPNDNQIVFRYSDAILLRAEALANLGDNNRAIEFVNIVKRRANATLVGDEKSGDELKETIWWERTKELLGEGHLFYDMVRTKNILDSDYTSHPLTLAAYNRRAWTWPISQTAFINNPYMTQNIYWNK